MNSIERYWKIALFKFFLDIYLFYRCFLEGKKFQLLYLIYLHKMIDSWFLIVFVMLFFALNYVCWEVKRNLHDADNKFILCHHQFVSMLFFFACFRKIRFLMMDAFGLVSFSMNKQLHKRTTWWCNSHIKKEHFLKIFNYTLIWIRFIYIHMNI